MKRFLSILTLLFFSQIVLANNAASDQTTGSAGSTASSGSTSIPSLTQTIEKASSQFITLDKSSVIDSRAIQVQETEHKYLLIALYRPTYILPYYYTASPDYRVYEGSTPNNQKIMRNEFKSQLSFVVPVWSGVLNHPNRSVNIAYTQLNYWQVYAASQYFRETNYEPEIFFEDHGKRWLYHLGFDHQSNGRGGDLERSWNRAVGTFQLSGSDWLISMSVWKPIFQAESSDLHNPNIAYYLGYDNFTISHEYKKATFSLQAQNIESGFHRGFIEPTISYPLFQHLLIYGQFFSGYGQSLIEYNHRTNAVGIGIAFNDWV